MQIVRNKLNGRKPVEIIDERGVRNIVDTLMNQRTNVGEYSQYAIFILFRGGLKAPKPCKAPGFDDVHLR